MIAVTGSTGFIGGALCEELKRQGKEFVCLARKESNKEILKKNNYKFVGVEFFDSKNLEKKLAGVEVVAHLAAVLKGKSDAFREGNIELLKNLLKASKNAGVKRFVFMSTAVVSSKFLDDYAETKIEGEKMVRESGLPFVILRPTIVYGKEDNKNLAKLAGLLEAWPVVFLPGGGKNLVQPVFVEDVAKALAGACEKRGALGRTFVLAGPKPVEFGFVAKEICRAKGLKKLFVSVPAWLGKFGLWLAGLVSPVLGGKQLDRFMEPKAYDIGEARKLLGFEPAGFEQGAKLVWGN